MTAFDLCGIYDDQEFILKRGKVIWEAISYKDNIDKCYISRVVEKGGKPFMMGLNYQSRYISPDTEIEILIQTKCTNNG